jgi:segregation and condensation protein A
VPFELALDQFSGPLQLLLELIEQERLPITDVSLAKVTEAYLRHLDEHEVPSEELADFLVVATRLLLIKSRAILPRPVEEEENGPALADQLRMYKRFVDAAAAIESMYGSGNVMFPRERVAPPKAARFAPPPSVTPGALADAFRSLLKRLEPFFALKSASLERVASVQERMSQLRAAILERSRLAFHDVVGGARSRVDVVVSFLALLELMKQRVVKAVQGESFRDIVITRND